MEDNMMSARPLGVWLILLLAGLLSVPVAATPQLFRPFSNDPNHILEGNWQSCREEDGTYAERVYDHVVNGVGKFEVHLGPYRQFAIFAGVQEEHRDHATSENLLGANYEIELNNLSAKQHWEIPSLGLMFTVTLAGGSRTDCESWYVLLEPLDSTH